MNCTTKPEKNQAFSLANVAQMDCLTLTPDIVGKIIGSTPNSIRVMAQTQEGRQALGFPVIRLGSDTRIPRAPFLRFMGWEGKINGVQEVSA